MRNLDVALCSGYMRREYLGTHEQKTLAISKNESSLDFVEGRAKEWRWARRSKMRCLWVGVRENPK